MQKFYEMGNIHSMYGGMTRPPIQGPVHHESGMSGRLNKPEYINLED